MEMVDLIPWLIAFGVAFILIETLLPLFLAVLGVILSPFGLLVNVIKHAHINKNKNWLYTQSKLLSFIHLLLLSLCCFVLHFFISDKLLILFLSLVLTLTISAILYTINPHWFKNRG